MGNFIKRVINRLSFERLKLRIQNLGALEKRFGFTFNNIHSDSRFKEQYKHYVAAISRADMAASLELSNVMYSLCASRKPIKLLDMGSGFSSYILRTYAAENKNAHVWSVDDDAAWLEKTKNYLNDSKVTTENLLTLDDLIKSNERDFDLILLDLNYVEVRKNYIKLVVDRCNTGGILVFDDVHKREFMTEVLSQTSNTVSLYDISDLTRDEFGRYSLLGVKDHI